MNGKTNNKMPQNLPLSDDLIRLLRLNPICSYCFDNYMKAGLKLLIFFLEGID